jgi:23S rRNA pseudouridine2605 synthase
MAQAGVASRRKCEEWITSGRVQVNGVIVRELGVRVDPKRDEILVDGKPLTRPKHVYILLNKPTGVITSVTDTHNRKTVVDLIHDIDTRIYPVGRLDFDTSGLLLLTNDGELTNRLIHPRYHIDKTYRVVARGSVDDHDLQRLEKGVELEDGLTAPATAKLVKRDTRTTTLLLTIHEGKNRQVRRMMDAIHHPVIELERIQMGPLTLGDLKQGAYRHLKDHEVAELYRIVNETVGKETKQGKNVSM